MIVDFSKFSSVKIGPVCEVSELKEICEFDGFIVGGANNLLISPNPPKLGVLSDKFDFIKFDGDILEVGAKTSAKKIFEFARLNNIGGFEICGTIPGQLGGLLTMNAGLKGFSISDKILNLHTSNGEIAKQNCGFEYRKSDISGVIFGAKFKINSKFDENLANEFKQARKNQPKGRSFGSCFKNPPNDYAGRLIESVNLKGYKIGGCGFSEVHANFLINYGGGIYDEAITLINLAKKRIFEEFGINLVEEVVIV